MALEGEKVCQKALKVAGEEVRKIEVQTAIEKHNKYSEKIGYKEIKVLPMYGPRNKKICPIGIRVRFTPKQATKQAKLKASGKYRATYWDKVKGLWYNNYGFYHNKTHNYVAGTDWIGVAFDKSQDKAYEIIQEELGKGLKL